MFTAALALFCVFFLTGPALYAQSEGIVIRAAPLSQEQLKGGLNDFGISRSETPLHQGQLIKISITKPARPPAQPNVKRDRVFWNFVNQRVYEDTVKIKEEKRILREKWQEWLGIDIFYPYYKAKEIESWVCDRTRVKIFNLRGRLKFENKQLRYTFSMKF
jgi:hypothetical protein